jgi:hypothetical protein
MFHELLPYVAIIGFAFFVFLSSNTWKLQNRSRKPLKKNDGKINLGHEDGILQHKMELEQKYRNGLPLTPEEKRLLFEDDTSHKQLELSSV